MTNNYHVWEVRVQKTVTLLGAVDGAGAGIYPDLLQRATHRALHRIVHSPSSTCEGDAQSNGTGIASPRMEEQHKARGR